MVNFIINFALSAVDRLVTKQLIKEATTKTMLKMVDVIFRWLDELAKSTETTVDDALVEKAKSGFDEIKKAMGSVK
jgi:hypothetical protein